MPMEYLSIFLVRIHSQKRTQHSCIAKTGGHEKKKQNATCKNVIQHIEWLSDRLEQLIDGFTANWFNRVFVYASLAELPAVITDRTVAWCRNRLIFIVCFAMHIIICIEHNRMARPLRLIRNMMNMNAMCGSKRRRMRIMVTDHIETASERKRVNEKRLNCSNERRNYLFWLLWILIFDRIQHLPSNCTKNMAKIRRDQIKIKIQSHHLFHPSENIYLILCPLTVFVIVIQCVAFYDRKLDRWCDFDENINEW